MTPVAFTEPRLPPPVVLRDGDGGGLVGAAGQVTLEAMTGLLHVGPLAAPACQPDEEELVLDLLKVAELVGLRLQTAGESRGPLQIAGKVRNEHDLEEEPGAFSCTFDEKGGGDSESL